MNPTDPLSFRPCQEPGSDRLRQVLLHLPQPLVLYAANGQLEYLNPAAQELQVPHLSQISSAAAPLNREVRLNDSHGNVRHFLINSQLLRNSAGEVDGLLESYTDITHQQQEAQRLQLLQGHLLELAHRDSLTNLANRRFLELALEKLAADKEQRIVALLYADLDGFKPVNDIHGHIVGDAVLGRVADRLRQTLRGTDLLARIGGDEFAILLDGISEAGAKAVASKIIQAIATPFADFPPPNQLGISIGICMFRTGPGMSKELFLQADLAMYRAKRRGGKQFELTTLGE